MNKFSTTIFVLSVSLGSLTAQTTTVPSYTNADLGLSPAGTANTNPNAIPGLTPANQNQTQAQSKYPALTPEQQQQFDSQMNELVQNAQTRVQNLTSVATDNTRMPMSTDKVVLESAIINLDVKKTLVEKFANSPSLRSPNVRNLLIQILSKDDIQAADLAALQSVVDAERPYTYP